ncbi:putative ferredoxin [Pusillimonas sp. T7-7]|nr:putative ferredoxin [Pusillimonas sp. T7-7]
MGSPLDWENHVFTRAGDQLMCARHGATFKPDTGECTGGPCQPSKLTTLEVSEEERDGVRVVLWWPEGRTEPA